MILCDAMGLMTHSPRVSSVAICMKIRLDMQEQR